MAHETSPQFSLQEPSAITMDKEVKVDMQKNVSHRQWLQQWLSGAPVSPEHNFKTQCML